MPENMQNLSYQGTEPSGESPKKPAFRKGMFYYLILVVALAGTWGYLLWNKSQDKQKETQLITQVISTDSARMVLQHDYDAANAQIDELTSTNTHMDSLVRSRNKDLSILRVRIRRILYSKNLTQNQLNQARSLIAQLNQTIDGFKQQVAALQQDNLALTSQRDSLNRNLDTASLVNKNLSHEVDLGSVLHASNIRISAIHLRKNGKHIATLRAPKADLMEISFNLDENMISPSGSKNVYVCIFAPDGSLLTPLPGSNQFTLADGSQKDYTAMKSISYTIGTKAPVNMEWKKNGKLLPGTYKVEIYEHGFLIGQGNMTMKKAGLFGWV